MRFLIDHSLSELPQSRGAPPWIAGTVAGLPGWELYVFRCSQLRSDDLPAILVGVVIQRGRLDGGSQFSAIGDPPSRQPDKGKICFNGLRVAQTEDRQTAARLVSELSRDFPRPAERPETAQLHLRAINLFSELAIALDSETASKREQLWKSAIDAAAAWLGAVIRL